MNHNSDWNQALIDAARVVADELAQIPEVQAVLLFGSPAVGAADEESDLDINAYCTRMPPPSRRNQAFKHLGGVCEVKELEGGSPTYCCDSFELPHLDESGFIYYEKVDDVKSRLIARRRSILLETLRLANLDIINGRRMETGSISASPQGSLDYIHSEAHLADIQDGTILVDPAGLLEQWKAEIREYPADARHEVVWRRLFFAGIACDDISRSLDRGDLPHVFTCKASWFEHFIRALFALNGRYYGKPKALEYHLHQFENRPEGCYARLCEFVSEARFEKAKAMAASLLSDTESIAEDLLGPFVAENLDLEK